eukprot:212788-Rhodomonas_salina.1
MSQGMMSGPLEALEVLADGTVHIITETERDKKVIARVCVYERGVGGAGGGRRAHHHRDRSASGGRGRKGEREGHVWAFGGEAEREGVSDLSPSQ